MYATNRLDWVPSPYGGYYRRPTFPNQQAPEWGYNISAEPFNAGAASISRPIPHQDFDPQLTEQGHKEIPSGPFPEEASLSQGVSGGQSHFMTAESIPEPPMVAPPQPLPAPQTNLAVHTTPTPTLAPQPPHVTQPDPAPQSSQPSPTVESTLSPEDVTKYAVAANDLLIQFRLNQKYNSQLLKPKSTLIPYSELGLKRDAMDEYREIIKEDIPLFIVTQKDWDMTFGYLDESSFHVFLREELENAERRGVSLPPLDNLLALYVKLYPLDPVIDRRLRELRLQNIMGGDH